MVLRHASPNHTPDGLMSTGRRSSLRTLGSIYYIYTCPARTMNISPSNKSCWVPPQWTNTLLWFRWFPVGSARIWCPGACCPRAQLFTHSLAWLLYLCPWIIWLYLVCGDNTSPVGHRYGGFFFVIIVLKLVWMSDTYWMIRFIVMKC